MNNTPTINIGDFLIRPKFLGFVEHVGVFLGNGLVFHNTPERGEHVSTVQEFSAGQPIRVQPKAADAESIIARVRRALENPKEYHLLFHNCEDTANETTEGKAKSPTIAFIIIAILIGLVIWLLTRSKK
jgi:hypothetical protein